MQTKPDITKKTTRTYRVAVLPGDGIGPEVVAAGSALGSEWNDRNEETSR